MRKISNEQFNEKYHLYKNTIYSIAYTYVHNTSDADDIVQDVFLKYLNSEVVFQTLDNERYWLIRVTINTSKNYLKKTWRKKVDLDDERVNRAPSYEKKFNESFNNEEKIFEIVYNLPQKYKEVIVLFYYEDLSINEIANTLNLSVSNVKKRLERGRNVIREKEIKNG